MPGAEIKLIPDPPHGDEICFRGRNIMMGYMGDPAKTAGAIDADGWLHSGDVGTMDEFGMVRITGRIKELLITRRGENIGEMFIVIVAGDNFFHCVVTHHHSTTRNSSCPSGRYNQVVASRREHRCPCW